MRQPLLFLGRSRKGEPGMNRYRRMRLYPRVCRTEGPRWFPRGIPVRAAGEGKTNMVRALPEEGAGVDKGHLEGKTGLIHAVKNGPVAVARLLCENGAERAARTPGVAGAPLRAGVRPGRISFPALRLCEHRGFGLGRLPPSRSWPPQESQPPRACCNCCVAAMNWPTAARKAIPMMTSTAIVIRTALSPSWITAYRPSRSQEVMP